MEPRLWNGLWSLGYGRIVYGTWGQNSYNLSFIDNARQHDMSLIGENAEIASAEMAVSDNWLVAAKRS